MTICIAVICEHSTVFGVADRMLTAGDVQFSPERSKFFHMTPSITVMVSGDVALAVELLTSVKVTVDARIRVDPDNWWSLEDVAALWREAYLARQRRDAETKFLAPIGLTSESFIDRQQLLAPTLARELTQELIGFSIPQVDVIFAGIDSTGPHLFVAHGAQVSCADAIGFATVGSGAYHARSQLMFAGHTAATLSSRGLYLAYVAKKRAEVAPGVGPDTDNFIIWALGQGSALRQEVLQLIEAAYRDSVLKSAEIAADIEGRVHAGIQAITVPAAPLIQEVADADGGEPPAIDPPVTPVSD